MIVAAVLFFFSAGLVIKMVYSPAVGSKSGAAVFQSVKRIS